MLGSWIRRSAFWVLDSLKGGVVKLHYQEVKKFAEEGSIAVNENQLEKLLAHACQSVPFYINNKNKIKINDFPVVSKDFYKESFDLFQSNCFLNKPLHQMSTSGSTGTPFSVNQDMNKRKRNFADIIYFNELCEQRLGDRFIFFRVWTEKIRKSKFEQFQQNIVPVDITHLDHESLEDIRQLLKADKSINSALAYASTYEHLANYLFQCADTPDMFHIKSLVTSSEVLDMNSKSRIKSILGCNIFDRYSNQECGILAQTDDCSEMFFINTASYYVELLKPNSDEPAGEGELGRIVVTDLFNFAMPIIRYDTGDLAIKCEQTSTSVSKFKSVQGRRVDVIYDTSGKKLTPHTMSNYMWKFDRLRQYQFIQSDAKEYVLKVSGAQGIYSKQEFDKTLRAFLGSDAEITVEYVDTIPVLESGKFKKVICNYVPK